MKICPQCRTTYTDDNLQFCLQDGTPLLSQNAAIRNLSEEETLVSPKLPRTTQVDWQNPSAPNWTNSEQPVTVEPPKKSRTGLTIALTALVTLIVTGGAFAGFLIYRHNQKTEIVQNQNTNVNSKPVNAANNSSSNSNQKTANANANATPTPTATPTAKPTLNPKAAEEVKSDVQNVIDDWKDATESRDIDSHLNDYADTVDYYNAGKVSSAKVRADREKAFSMYDNIEVNIDNVKITPDETGEKATVVFDKEWNFQNEEKSNNGKVQQQLTFGKINGTWRITGEKDLKVYYSNK